MQNIQLQNLAQLDSRKRFLSGEIDLSACRTAFQTSAPFPNVVIDNFFRPEVAEHLANEFPDLESDQWRLYNNPLEKKKLLNHWDKFPPLTYQVLAFLNTQEFVQVVNEITGIANLSTDIGLNGGGWHIYGRGGKLNVHLDYSVHPKLRLERRLNVIVYLTPGWKQDWGGGLGLWTHDDVAKKPRELVKTIDCVFNRAILFDTTQNSWHGLPDPLDCPENVQRKSIAVYYLTPCRADVADRGKALFAPYKEQAEDKDVLELIKKRASVDTASDVYGDKPRD